MSEINAARIILMLDPTAEIYAPSTEYEDVVWHSPVTVTKAQFTAGVTAYPAWLAQQQAQVLAKKEAAQAKLEALGLTVDDLAALGL